MTTRKTTPKPPARRPGSQRSGAKRASAPVRYSEEQRAEALDLVAAQGIAHAHRATGVSRATLSRWAKAAGIDVGEQARARTANATAVVRQRAAEVTANTVDLLEHHIAQGGHYLGVVAGVNALAAERIASLDPDLISIEHGIAGPYTVLGDRAAADAAKVALALAGLPLAARDAEGLVTRAIHDLQLLRGEATERGELVVEFTVPRPDPGGVVVVEQDHLGIEAP